MENKILNLDLCMSTILAQITVLETTKMKQKSSMTDEVHKNGATVKNVKDVNQLRMCVVSRNSVSKAFHLKFKAKLLEYSSSGIFFCGI